MLLTKYFCKGAVDKNEYLAAAIVYKTKQHIYGW